jgi:hypothetical protein
VHDLQHIPQDIRVLELSFVETRCDGKVHRHPDQPRGLQPSVAELEEGVVGTVVETRGWGGILHSSGDAGPKTFLPEDGFELALPDGELRIVESLERLDVLDGLAETSGSGCLHSYLQRIKVHRGGGWDVGGMSGGVGEVWCGVV